MTVLLVLFFFVLFLMIDYFKSRNKVAIVIAEDHQTPHPSLQPALVNGFSIPTNLSYHPGHMWALKESPSLVRVGMDDFASKLIGKIDSIKLPQRNTWIRQGQKFATITRDDHTVDLISPVEGVVTDINPAFIRDPKTVRKSPYNEGWLMAVDSPDQKTYFRNLFNGDVAKWWVEDAVNRLHPAMAQDGGEACDDFLTAIGGNWETATREFLRN